MDHLSRIVAKFEIPFLFISHQLEEMRMMTDKVLVMKKGKISSQMVTEDLARTTLATNGRGYTNHFHLREPEDLGTLLRYRWGASALMLVKTEGCSAGHFGLNSRDILLFKNHPEATSARNMIECRVKQIYQTDWLVGVEMECDDKRLIAEIVPQSLTELGLRPGSKVIAVFKASAFQRLY